MKNRNKRKGFTLIELLAVVAIISLLFCFGFVVVSNLVNSSNKMVDKATKNAIINAAELYAIEFRSSLNWEEEIKKIENSENTFFCVSIDSLINYGYFKDENNKLKDYRKENVVKFVVNNGVYDYEIIGKNDEESSSCMYFEYETNIVSGSEGVIEINEISIDGNASTISYQLLKQDEEKILLNLSGDIKFKEEKLVDIIPTYIVLVIDDSLSMWCHGSSTTYRENENKHPVCTMNGTKVVSIENMKPFFDTVEGQKIYKETNYAKAIDAASAFFSNIYVEIPKAKVAGVKFHKYISFNSGFIPANKYNEIIFGYGSFYQTNTGAGLDAASALLYFEEKNKIVENLDNAFVYTVLLFDGQANFYPRFNPSNGNLQNLVVDDLRNDLLNNGVNREGYLMSSNIVNNPNGESFKNYFDNFFDRMFFENFEEKYRTYGNVVNLGYCNAGATIESLKPYYCYNSVINSAKILRETFNSNIFSIAYSYTDLSDVDVSMKTIATRDNKLCRNSDFVDEYGNKYCYYEADADNVSTIMSLIADDVSGSIRNTKINKLKLIITPNSEVFGKILKDGEEISNIEKVIDLNGEILNSDETIDFLENYELVLKEKNEIFTKCSFTEGTCNQDFKLFDVKVVLNSDVTDTNTDGSFEYHIENNSEITLNAKKIITLN